MTYYLESDLHYRISKSGYSIKTGWSDETRIVASYPGGTAVPLDAARFEQWLRDAQHICDLHNAALRAQPADGGVCACGRPAEYEANDGGRCCNKYGFRCAPPESGGQGDYAAMIDRHQLRADECPGQSMVVLASSMRRLLTHPPAQASGVVTDSARLDWLDRQGFAYGFEDMHEGNRWTVEGAYANVRAAIDEALAQGGGNER